MPLSNLAFAELHWWLIHLKNANQSLQGITVDYTIQTEASEQGRGAIDENTPTGGRWSSLKRNHISVLELKAFYWFLSHISGTTLMLNMSVSYMIIALH